MVTVQNHIDGRQVPARSGATLANWEPATGAVSGTLPDSDATDVAAAVQAAERAFPAWAATPAAERSRALHRLADALRARAPELAHAESVDTGKPLSLATPGHPAGRSNFDFFADAASQFASEAHPMDGRALNYTLRHPLGVVGCISPWNLPLYLFSWKVAPALAAGKLRGRQAVRGDAGDGALAGPTLAPRRACRRACSTWCTASAPRWAPPSPRTQG